MEFKLVLSDETVAAFCAACGYRGNVPNPAFRAAQPHMAIPGVAPVPGIVEPATPIMSNPETKEQFVQRMVRRYVDAMAASHRNREARAAQPEMRAGRPRPPNPAAAGKVTLPVRG